MFKYLVWNVAGNGDESAVWTTPVIRPTAMSAALELSAAEPWLTLRVREVNGHRYATVTGGKVVD